MTQKNNKINEQIFKINYQIPFKKIFYFNNTPQKKINSNLYSDELINQLTQTNNFQNNIINEKLKFIQILKNTLIKLNETENKIKIYYKNNLENENKIDIKKEKMRNSIVNYNNLNKEHFSTKIEFEKKFNELLVLNSEIKEKEKKIKELKNNFIKDNKIKNKIQSEFDNYKKNINEISKKKVNIFQEKKEILNLKITEIIFDELISITEKKKNLNIIFNNQEIEKQNSFSLQNLFFNKKNNLICNENLNLNLKIKFENIYKIEDNSLLKEFFIKKELFFLSCFFNEYKLILEYQLQDPFNYIGSNIYNENKKIETSLKNKILKLFENNKKTRKPISLLSGNFDFENFKNFINHILNLNNNFLKNLEIKNFTNKLEYYNNLNEEIYIFNHNNENFDNYIKNIYNKKNFEIGFLKIFNVINNREFIQIIIICESNENNLSNFQKLIKAKYDLVFGEKLIYKRNPKILFFINNLIEKNYDLNKIEILKYLKYL